MDDQQPQPQPDQQDVIEPMDQDLPFAEVIPAEPVPPPAPDAPILPLIAPTSAPETPELSVASSDVPDHIAEVQLEGFGAVEYDNLLNKELRTGKLEVMEYIKLFFAELLQNDPRASWTLQRAKIHHPKNTLVTNLLPLSDFVKTLDVPTALKNVRLSYKQFSAYKDVLDEFVARVVVFGIFSVAKTYNTIAVSQFDHILGVTQKIPQLVEQLQWPVVGQYIHVSENQAVLQYAATNINPVYGSFQRLPTLSINNANGSSISAIDSVSKLVDISDALSKIKLPPKIENKENDIFEKVEGSPPAPL